MSRYLAAGYGADLALRTALAYAVSLAAAAAAHASRRAPPGSRRRAAACAAAAAALLAAPSAVLDARREAVAIVPVVGIFSLAAFKVWCRGRGAALRRAPPPSSHGLPCVSRGQLARHPKAAPARATPPCCRRTPRGPQVLAFAVGRGPLQSARLPGFVKFAAALALPVIPLDGAAGVARKWGRPSQKVPLHLHLHLHFQALLAALPRPSRRRPLLSPPSAPRTAFKLGSRGGGGAPGAPAAAFLLSYALKTAASFALIAACYFPWVPLLPRYWLHALLLSLAMGGIWDACCAAAVGLYGLEVAAAFDAPWLSSSFSDYWSRWARGPGVAIGSGGV
jgi:hypothetical protein